MTGVSRRTVYIAALLLVAAACYGIYMGWRRSSVSDDLTGVEVAGAPAEAVAARNAAPVVEPPPSVLSEAQIRAIARQEAQSLLARPQPEPAAAGAAPVPQAATPAPRPPPPRPAPSPEPPRLEPEPPGQPPLF